MGFSGAMAWPGGSLKGFSFWNRIMKMAAALTRGTWPCSRASDDNMETQTSSCAANVARITKCRDSDGPDEPPVQDDSTPYAIVGVPRKQDLVVFRPWLECLVFVRR